MKRHLLFVFPLLLAGIVRAQPAQQIAPYIDDQVMFVMHIDFAKVEFPVLEDKVKDLIKRMDMPTAEAQRAQDEMNKSFAELKGWIDAFTKAGANDLYFVFTLAEFPSSPVYTVLPLKGGGDARAVQDLVSKIDRNSTAQTHGNAVVHASAQTHERLKSLKPFARDDLAKAFTAAGDGVVQIVFIPNADTRKALAEMLPKFPNRMGGGSAESLLKGMNWFAMGAALKPEMSIGITIQSPDAAAATQLAATLNQLGEAGMKEIRNAVAQSPKAAAMAGDLDALAKALVAKADGDRVIVKIGAEQASLVAGLIFPAIAKARQSASNAVAANNIKQLLLACHMHATERNGEYPRDLAAAAKFAELPGNVLKNPQTDKEFVYLRPDRGAAGAAEQIVIYEEPAGPNVTAGFADGHVEVMGVQEFKERLDASKKRAARQ
jgi:hypothetical protein